MRERGHESKCPPPLILIARCKVKWLHSEIASKEARVSVRLDGVEEGRLEGRREGDRQKNPSPRCSPRAIDKDSPGTFFSLVVRHSSVIQWVLGYHLS